MAADQWEARGIVIVDAAGQPIAKAEYYNGSHMATRAARAYAVQIVREHNSHATLIAALTALLVRVQLVLGDTTDWAEVGQAREALALVEGATPHV